MFCYDYSGAEFSECRDDKGNIGMLLRFITYQIRLLLFFLCFAKMKLLISKNRLILYIIYP
jgi:hypothetical protein